MILLHQSFPLLALALTLLGAFPIAGVDSFTFTFDKEECFVEHVDGPKNVMVAFVVTSALGRISSDVDARRVNVKVGGPDGGHLAESLRKTEDEINFFSSAGGDYRICFHSTLATQLTVSLEIMEYFTYRNKQSGSLGIKGEQIDVLQQELLQLQDDVAHAHHDVWYSFFLAQQHTDIDKKIGERLMVKTLAQGLLLVICTLAQVVILRWLFEQRPRVSKV